ncbi:MAG: hypothetical protein KDC71_03900 [Acidobacteria bacterium]|nr:hypothetical protein [Acidobacteriota bacterium]
MSQAQKHVPKLMYKLLALFLALVMWVTFSGKSDGPQTRIVQSFTNVPLIQLGVPQNMKLTSEYYQITVSLSGNETELRELDSRQVEVRLDLSNYQAGTYNIALSPENVAGIPPKFSSIQVEEIQPRVVKLSIEPKIRKSVRIVLNTTGRAAQYFEVGTVEVIPPKVEIEGPESQIQALDFLLANPVFIGDAQADLRGKVTFDYKTQVPPDTTIVNLNDLTYHVEIREIRDTKKYKGAHKVTYVLPKDSNLKLKPKEVLIEVSGTLRDLAWFKSEWVLPKVTVPEEWNKQALPIQAEFELGEEAQANEPAWQERLKRLEITFVPAQAELQ